MAREYIKTSKAEKLRGKILEGWFSKQPEIKRIVTSMVALRFKSCLQQQMLLPTNNTEV
jgi:hypothetical protein